MSDKQEQGWLSGILGQTDKFILAVGGYESSVGIEALGQFEDDESDTEEEEEEEEEEQEQSRRSVDMRLHLDNLGSFDDDEEDSSEESPLLDGKGDEAFNGAPGLHKEWTPRKGGGNSDPQTLDNITPHITQDFVPREVPAESGPLSAGVDHRGIPHLENKHDITGEGSTSIPPSVVAPKRLLEGQTNSTNAMAQESTYLSSIPEEEQDRDNVTSPRNEDRITLEAMPGAGACDANKRMHEVPDIGGAISVPFPARSNVVEPIASSLSSTGSLAKAQMGGEAITSIRNSADEVPKSKTVASVADTPQAKHAVAKGMGNRGRGSGDERMSETLGTAHGRNRKYSHVGDKSWLKAESDTVVRPAKLCLGDREREQDSNPASYVEETSKSVRNCSSSESKADAGAGPPAMKEIEKEQGVRDERETTVRSRAHFSEVEDSTKRNLPAMTEDEADADLEKAISLSLARPESEHGDVELFTHHPGVIHNRSSEDPTRKTIEHGPNSDAGKLGNGLAMQDVYALPLEDTVDAATTIGSKRGSDDRELTQGVRDVANTWPCEDFAPTKRERTYRRNRLGVMRHSSRLDDVLQEQDREFANTSVGNGESGLLSVESLGNIHNSRMATTPWPDQALRPYDTPIVDFGLPSSQAKALSKIGFGSETLIICSPFRRCLQTAGVVARTLGINKVTVWLDVGERMDKVRKEISEALTDINVCRNATAHGRQSPMFSYLDREEMSLALGEGVRLDTVTGKQPPVDESGVEAKQRFIASISRLRGDYLPQRPVLVIAHGDTLDAAGESLASQIIYEAAYCAWAVFDLEDGYGGCVAESYGLQMIPL